MCGIFAYLGHKPNAGTIILDGLKSLEYRGYDSWGVAIKTSDDKIHLEKHTGKIGNNVFPEIHSFAGIGHTRWATHGGVTENNAHPHTNAKRTIIVVHNGIVENFSEIKNMLINEGYSFISETDTEVIAHLLDHLHKHISDHKQLVLELFSKVRGMNAIIVFFPESEEFFAIKNGSPVVFGKNENELFIASDASALIPHTNSVYFLDDNEMLYLSRKQYAVTDNEGLEKHIEFTELSYSKEDVDLGSFPHFMMKEIHEQPRVLRSIIDTQKRTIEELAEVIKKAYGTYFIGCGTAFYAGLAGTYLFSKIAKRHVNVAVGSEFPYLIDFIKEKSLVIALSQSGETIDIISSLKKVKEKNTKIMAITNVLGSTLYRMSDYKLLLNAGPEKCVLATKSFTAKIALLYLISHAIDQTYEDGCVYLKKAIAEVERIIKDYSKLQKLADMLMNKNHIFILGRGVSYPTALESALKIKEVSYIHAEGFAGGELKHGVMALIEEGTPVIIYNPSDETYEDTLSSAHEVKARGAYVIGISDKPNAVYNEFIQIENCGDATVIPNVVIAQLLGYFLALAKGYDPDKPRNLAKSVTVK
ncbi:MAG: glutamine--fructose-6-phosphate transaminase (isomerizing) [Candidatus Roizmanbacteria bacterium]